MIVSSVMASKPSVPDYDLDDTMELTSPVQVQAIGNRLRTTILGLLHERAATVTELAMAVGRPKSTVAYHVNVLLGAGLVRVVRTRRVRAIEERYSSPPRGSMPRRHLPDAQPPCDRSRRTSWTRAQSSSLTGG